MKFKDVVIKGNRKIYILLKISILFMRKLNQQMFNKIYCTLYSMDE